MWLVGSNGTTPAGSESAGQPQINWLARGTATINTAATLSLVSANGGEYYVELNASEVSAPGVAAVHYRSANALPQSTYFQISPINSNDSMRAGLFALPNVASSVAGGLLTVGTGTGQIQPSAGSVGLIAQVHSGATVAGLTSGVTLFAGTHSGATLAGLSSGVTLFADTHSGATVQGVTRINSSVTIANANYSAVTVRLDLQNYSGVTVGVGNILEGNYSAVSFSVTTGAAQGISDTMLLRSIAGGADGGRTVQDALRPLRNRTLIAGSVLTVYSEDDATSAWTASITTTSDSPIAGVNPAGGSA